MTYWIAVRIVPSQGHGLYVQKFGKIWTLFWRYHRLLR